MNRDNTLGKIVKYDADEVRATRALDLFESASMLLEGDEAAQAVVAFSNRQIAQLKNKLRRG